MRHRSSRRRGGFTLHHLLALFAPVLVPIAQQLMIDWLRTAAANRTR